MTNTQKPSDIQQKVLEQIDSGKVRMRSRLFFILKSAIVLGVALLILLLTIFLASFIFFGLRVGGHEALLGFGARGVLPFLSVFPWPLLLLDIALLILLESLLHRFKFAYRRPLLYIFLGLLVLAGTLGLLLDRETPFHDDRLEEAEQGELIEPLELIYESARQTPPEELGVYRGFVTQVEEKDFVMTNNDNDSDEDDGTWRVESIEGTEQDEVEVGDRVYVAGDREDDVIRAYGVRVLED